MIGRIVGKLIEKHAPELLIDVQGIGYEVQAPMSTFYRLPELGQQVTLHTHFVVREDAQLLFGFYEKDERRLFRSLIKVNGVGPKLALTILSGIETEEFVRCVHDNDSAALVKLPGVGKKTAERLIVEMRDRLADWEPAASPARLNIVTNGNVAGGGGSQVIQEAESALVALGYKPQDAAKAIAAAQRDMAATEISSETLIRSALKSMVS